MVTARRLAVFAYGVLTYALFLLTVVYVVIFAGKTIDNGARSSAAVSVAVDLALVALFGVQHTIMARPAFKRRVPQPIERSTFVLASAVCLDLLFWFWRPLPGTIWNTTGAARAVLTALFAVGWALVVASTFLIDHFDLFGVRHVTLYLRGIPYTPVPFKESFVYRHVRHPLMASFLIAFWATPRMSVGHLLFAAGMTAYIFIGIAFEERELARAFGAEYERYRARTSMLFPGM